MLSEETARLLALHRAKALGESDLERLMEAALADQEVFDALTDGQVFGSLLDDVYFRTSLRDALRAKPSWFRRPFTWTLAALVATAVVVIAIVEFRSERSKTELAVTLSTDRLPAATMLSVEGTAQVNETDLRERIMQLPLRQVIPGSLGLNKERYRIGEMMRIGFRAERDANALLFERRGDGTVVRLFPNRFVSSTQIRAQEKVLIPPSGQGDMKVEAPAGTRRLRLVLLPVDVNPFSLAAVEMNAQTGRISIIERTYEVAGPK